MNVINNGHEIEIDERNIYNYGLCRRCKLMILFLFNKGDTYIKQNGKFIKLSCNECIIKSIIE